MFCAPTYSYDYSITLIKIQLILELLSNVIPTRKENTRKKKWNIHGKQSKY